MRPATLRPRPKNVTRQAVAAVITVPAPSLGWNARDPITDLQPGEALTLENWLPIDGAVQVRPGWESHATGISAPVETLMAWAGGAGAAVFAAAGDEIFDVTAAGAVGAAAVSGLGSARFHSVNFANAAGAWLVAVNGVDDRQLFDGSSWTTSPAITGVAASDLDFVTAHKARLWFCEKDSLSAWYLAPLAVGGAASEYSLKALAMLGGRLVAIVPWTRDGGAGPDDELVFITSEGEAIVFAGTDPASSSTWALRGVYRIPRPLGDRCAIKSGPDILILTVDGLFSLSQVAIAAAAERDAIAITDRVRNALRSAARVYGDDDGWQIIEHGAKGWLFINAPSTNAFEQYVRSGPNAGWCKFTSLNAGVWLSFQNQLYMGQSDGVVAIAGQALSDGGDSIAARVKPAFQGLGPDRTRRKSFVGARPLFNSDAVVTPTIGFLVDYQDREPEFASALSEGGGEAWDVAVWDVSVWGGAMAPTAELVDIYDEGRVVSPVVAIALQEARLSLAHIDVLTKAGGFL